MTTATRPVQFKTKIGMLVASAVVGMLLLSLLSIWQLRSHITDGRKGQLVTAVASALSIVQGYEDQASKGTLPVEEAQKRAKDALRAIRFGESMKDYVYVFTLEGNGVMHPFKPEWDGQPMIGKVRDGNNLDLVAAVVNGAKSGPGGKAFVPMSFSRPGSDVLVPKLQYVVTSPGWRWVVGAGLYMDDTDAAVREVLIEYVAVVLLMILVLAGAGVLIARSVLAQIGGEPANAVAAMREVAQGNLTVDLKAPVRGSLMAELGSMVASLRSTVSGIKASTDSIATASAQIATGSMDLSVRTEQTASNLQQTASTMEELTSTVNSTSSSAVVASDLARAARASAAHGGTVVSDVVATMDKITESSKRIADIIGVIDGIAFQTNILALNAAVEAARAGEQGRGFAVVASEVRSLAHRSGQAAKEIKTLIEESVDRVNAGAQLVSEAGTSMHDIVANVERVGAIIDEISEATREQSQGISLVNSAVSELDRATQQNAALVEESTAAAEGLKDQALRLSQTVEGFRLEVAQV